MDKNIVSCSKDEMIVPNHLIQEYIKNIKGDVFMENIKIKINAEVDQESIKEIESQIKVLEDKLHNIKVGFKIDEEINTSSSNKIQEKSFYEKFRSASEAKSTAINNPIILNEKDLEHIGATIIWDSAHGYFSSIVELSGDIHPEYANKLIEFLESKGYKAYCDYSNTTNKLVLNINWR